MRPGAVRKAERGLVILWGIAASMFALAAGWPFAVSAEPVLEVSRRAAAALFLRPIRLALL